MTLSRTCLYDLHQELGGRMVEFGGWDMPLQYSSIRDEALAVRNVAGVFDVTHMGRYELRGAGAEASLQRLLTNEVAALEPGHAVYSVMCREAGGVVDDVIAYKHSPERLTIVVNAGNRAKDWEWIESHLEPGVELRDLSDDLALIAFQGPQATALLPAKGHEDVPAFGILEDVEVAGTRAHLIARTGYTGEDGWELMVPAADAQSVFRRLLATDAAVRPCGLGARDVCRLEAGLRLYGNDMDEGTNPYEAGLGWTVKLDKGDFVGREALVEVKAAGPSHVTVGLRGAGRTIPRHGAEVLAGGDSLGTVTSGTWSFFLEQGIGMARLRAGSATAGDSVQVAGHSGPAPAEVVRLPFYRARREAESKT